MAEHARTEVVRLVDDDDVALELQTQGIPRLLSAEGESEVGGLSEASHWHQPAMPFVQVASSVVQPHPCSL